MLEFKGLENRIKQMEQELKDKNELTPQVKSLLLNMKANIALLKGQYNHIQLKYMGGKDNAER